MAVENQNCNNDKIDCITSCILIKKKAQRSIMIHLQIIFNYTEHR